MQSLVDFVREALREDIGRGDLFAKHQRPKAARAVIKTKSGGVFAGLIYAKALAREMDLVFKPSVGDGDLITAGDTLILLEGSDIALLQAERTLLNIVQHSSGIATHTRKFVDRLRGSNIALLDTRKTRPLLRNLEKYSTRVGGAVNHRMGLDDCLMIKDTHLAAIDNLVEFVAKARRDIPWTATIEIECETIAIAQEAFAAKADIIMCDNMAIDEIKEVVKLRDKLAPQIKIEASGNITLENIENYKNIGIDALSTGSLIHHAVWLDYSMKIV
ncbi:putative nicotinate-nucleotide pyrophosphorylase [carboxylating] [Campylobacterota bacterium]|nr:putative nicotinate-nucleotide pyrophosphorylase [carboxylating] [Campylobacterota bacterium]